MKIVELFAAQLEREAAISRRVLERVPTDRPDWKPHDKSTPLGYLAQLVATMPSWISLAIVQDELDLATGPKPTIPGSTKELLDAHEKAVAEGGKALRGTSDEFLVTTSWRLLVAGKTVLDSPRHVVVEDTFTHLAHHRGQLSVYMRLLGAALPSVYGPTADEPSFG